MPRSLLLVRVALVMAAWGSLERDAWAQGSPGPMQRCNVQVGNQVAPVDRNGNWRVNNIAASGNRQRARLTCEDPLRAQQGFSDLGVIVPNRVTIFPTIPFNGTANGPTSLRVAGPSEVLNSTTPVQLTVTGLYSGAATRDLTAAASGTDYLLTAPAVGTVGADGVFTPITSGRVLVTAVNEGTSASIVLSVAIGPDVDGDGIPDDWERTYGLNPNDPTDAFTDTDADNLNNRDEYLAGTHPFEKDTDRDGIEDQEETLPGVDGVVTNPLLLDTDGDYIPDFVELMAGTNPADPGSVDLDASIIELASRPRLIRLMHNPLRDEPSVRMQILGRLLNDTGVDLTAHPAMSYDVADNTLANMGTVPGEVIGLGPAGDTTVRAELVGSIHSVTVPLQARRFQPAALAQVPMSGCGSGARMSFAEPYLFVACGTNGVRVVGLPPAAEIAEVAAFAVPAVAAPVQVAASGAMVYVAGGSQVAPVGVRDARSPEFLDPFGSGGTIAWLDADSGLLAVARASSVDLHSLSNPASPPLVGTLPVATSTVVRVDLHGTRMAVIRQDRVALIVDVADPAQPTVLSQVTLPTTVAALNDTSLVASTGGFGAQAWSLANPASPVAGPVVGSTAFRAVDIAGAGTLGLVGDLFRVNSVPILQLRNALQPIFAATVDFAAFGDDNAQSIAADRQYVAIMTDRSRVQVGRYDAVADNGTSPPTCSWITPVLASSVVVGQLLLASVQATDDVVVSQVDFRLDGAPVASRTALPWQTEVPIVGVPGTRTLQATAYDLAGNQAECPSITVQVDVDPGTTVVGRVVDMADAQVGGANVAVTPAPAAGGTTTTLANGTFTITDVPTWQLLKVTAAATIMGKLQSRVRSGITPVPGGVTDIGDLRLLAADYPVTMGPVGTTITFDAFAMSPGGRPSRMGPIATTITFDAFAEGVGGATVRMGPVAHTITFDAFAQGVGGRMLVMGPVGHTITFDAFAAQAGGVPLTMGPVSSSVTFDTQ